MISEIQAKFSQDKFEYSEHALQQGLSRKISIDEVLEAIRQGEVIEDYPDDRYGPSCLIFGFTKSGRPLHIQCTYPERPLIKVITLYEPNIELWINHKIRRLKDEK